MKSLVIWLVKKYALSAIKDAVSANKDKVAKYATATQIWLIRLDNITGLLNSLVMRLKDGELTDEEAEEVINEANAILDSIKA
jgi:hypothetical protein